jgi:hypothetical protein
MLNRLTGKPGIKIMEKNMIPIKPALLTTAALISLLSLFPAASLAADAARVAGNLTVDGLHFRGDPNNTLITKPSDLAFPWTILDQNIYYLTGNVGIGLMQPDSALTVKGADSSPVRIGTTGCGANFAGIGLFGLMSGCGNYAILGDNGAQKNLFINRPADAEIDFRMNNVNQMILDQYGGLRLDANNANDGALHHTAASGAGLSFGSNSGEGIASKRTAGGNLWGLDFYTMGVPRLSITSGGNVAVRNNAGSATISMDGRTGNISANNLPGVQFDVPVVPMEIVDPIDLGGYSFVMSGLTATVKTITIGVPADGYLVLTGSLYALSGASRNILVEYNNLSSLQLFDETSNITFASALFGTESKIGTHTVQGVLPVTAGPRTISLKVRTDILNDGGILYYNRGTGSLIAMYFPVRY